MTLPTKTEKLSELMEYIIKSQEAAATIAHLVRDEDALHAQGWMAVSEMFKNINQQIIKLAVKGRLN